MENKRKMVVVFIETDSEDDSYSSSSETTETAEEIT